MDLVAVDLMPEMGLYHFLAKIGTKVTEVNSGHLALGPPHSTQIAQVDGPTLRAILHDNDAWF